MIVGSVPMLFGAPRAQAIALGSSDTPYVLVYAWSATGFGTKFANPATLPTSGATGVAFTSNGDAIATSHGAAPRVSAYPWSTGGFGTKFANPATLATNAGFSVAFT